MAYEVIGMMRNAGLQKDINDHVSGGSPVRYLNAQERNQYLIDVHGGRLRYRTGGQMIDTYRGHGHIFIFIMTGEGEIFMASEQEVTHHPSFVSGNPVAAAGTIKVVGGRIVLITSDSGHYQPPKEFLDQFVCELKKRDADLSVTEYKFGANKKQKKHNILALTGDKKIIDQTKVHPDKTRLIAFGRFAAQNREKRGLGKPETFSSSALSSFAASPGAATSKSGGSHAEIA